MKGLRKFAVISALVASGFAYAVLPGLEAHLQQIIGGADVGVALITSGGDVMTCRGGDYYDMCSVMKFHQAAALARTMDYDSIMDAVVKVEEADLHPNTWSPMRARLTELPYEASLVELLDYSLNYSDNNACDIIFDRFIAPERVEQCLRDAGLASELSVRSTEAQMHADNNRIPNLSTPLDAATCIYRFFTADTTASATLVKAIMARDTPFGKNRIAAGVAQGDTKVFNKTGTGYEGSNGTPRALNDLAFVSYKRSGGYSCYALAVFLRDFSGTTAEGEKLIADISEAVWSAVVVNESMAMNEVARVGVKAKKESSSASEDKYTVGDLLIDVVASAVSGAIDEKLSK